MTCCYAPRSQSLYVFAQVTRDGAAPMTVIAAPQFLTNQYLADEGNASLALNLLGTHSTCGLVHGHPLRHVDPG